MTITIKDVARKANVSISTVSKVINNNPSISQKTTDKVFGVVEELGYRPNIRARNFVQKRTNLIIFLARKELHAAFNNPYMFEIMTGIEESISKKGYYISFKSVDSDADAVEFLLNAIAQKYADGIIINGSLATKELNAILTESSFPYLIVGKPNFQTKASWIDTNNYLSGQICGEYLIKRGYHKIAFVGGVSSDNIFKQRLYGFLQAMRENYITVPSAYIKNGPSTKESGFMLTNELLEAPNLPEAIICENNYIALGVLKSITTHGLKIPEEVIYICFDEFPLARTMDPCPIVVDIDVYDLGIQAGISLLQRIRNPLLQIQTYSTIPHILAH